jgi:integrase
LRSGRHDGGALAARTVGHAHRVLHKALAQAAATEIITRNVAAIVAPPKVESTEIEILSAGQVADVLKRLEGMPIYPIVAVALATGMRRGEILALRWQDIDLEADRLRVEQSLEQTKAGGLRFKSPKTRAGRRSIALPPQTVAVLRDHRRRQLELRLALGAGKLPADALVFARYDGSPRSPRALSKEWSRLVSTRGLPLVTFHALRHSHASALIASGLDVLTISRRLGHGSPAITLGVYGHLFSNTDDKAAEAISAVLGPAPAAPKT